MDFQYVTDPELLKELDGSVGITAPTAEPNYVTDPDLIRELDETSGSAKPKAKRIIDNGIQRPPRLEQQPADENFLESLGKLERSPVQPTTSGSTFLDDLQKLEQSQPAPDQPEPVEQRAEEFIRVRKTVNGKEYIQHKNGGIYDAENFEQVDDPAVLEAFGRREPTKVSQKVIDSQRGEQPLDLGDLGNEFLRSAGEQNLQMMAQFALINHDLTGNELSKTFADSLAKAAEQAKGKIKPRTAPQFTGIKSRQDFIDWAQAATGQGLGSYLAPIIGGTLGALGGKRAGGRWGGRIGGAFGVFGGSALLNMGEMRQELVDLGVTDPQLRGKVAIEAGGIMAALDTATPEAALTRMLGTGARQKVKRALARRILQETLKGATVEGSTEGVQEAVEYVSGRKAAGKEIKPEELVDRMVNAFTAAALPGGTLRGASGMAPDQVIGPQQPAPAAPQPGLGQVPGELKTDKITPEQALSPQTTQNNSVNNAPQTEAQKVTGPTLEQQISILQEMGYDDDAIAEMGDDERAAAAREGMDAGITPIEGLPQEATQEAQGRPEPVPAPTTPPVAEMPQTVQPESVPAVSEGTEPELIAPAPADMPTEVTFETETTGPTKGWVKAKLGKFIGGGWSQEDAEADLDRKLTKAGTPQGEGTRNRPVRPETPQDIETAIAPVPPKSDAQAEVGNYQHQHLKLHGLDIAIETRKGEERVGKGGKWRQIMPAHYGYLKRSKPGRDGKTDVFVGDDLQSTKAFVIDQHRPKDGSFDEPKVVVAVPDRDTAIALYDQSFSDGSGPTRRRGVTETTIDKLHSFIEDGNNRQPFVRQKRFHTAPTTRGPVVETPLTEQGVTAPQVVTPAPVDIKVNKPKPPQDFISWIISQGGIRDDTGELKAMDAQRRPGLVRKTGKSADAIRELAVESGYLQELGFATGRQAETTGNDVYDLIAEGLGGRKSYPVRDLPQALEAETKRHAAVAPEAPPEFHEYGPQLYGLFQKVAMRPSQFNREDLEIAKVRLEQDPTLDVGELLERIAMQMEVADNMAVLDEDLPFAPEPLIEGHANEALARPSEAQPVVPEGSVEGEAPAEPESVREERQEIRGPGASEQESQQPEPTVERTEAGQQTVLPGAERIGQGEQAQRQADKPLKPKTAQKPADEGLFSDEKDQTSLFRREGKAPTANAYRFAITEKQREHLKKRVNVIARRILGRTFPDIEFHDTLPNGFQAVFSPQEWMIYMALRMDTDPRLIIRHEAIHVLRKSGLFTDGEWRTLSRLAKQKWMDEFQIAKRYEHYAERDNFDELLIEEAIAEAFLDYSANGAQKTAGDRIFERVKTFIEAVRSMLKGEGFTSVEGIFQKIESGKVAERAEAKARAPRPIGDEVLTAAPPVESEAFKRWFGKSKVIDGQGDPLVVYHGTPEKFSAFDTSKEGSHFGTLEQASNIRGKGKLKVGAYYLSIKNPLRVADIGTWSFNGVHYHLSINDIVTDAEADAMWDAWQKSDEAGWGVLKSTLAKHGYDGFVYENEQEGQGDSYVAFYPEQIKSVNNRGTFDPNNPNILTAAPPPEGNWAPGEKQQEPIQGPKPEDFDSNINLDYIAAPEDVKSVITEVGKRAGEFVTERRGVVSNEQTAQLAKELGLKAGDLFKRQTGEAFNAHEIYAARVLMVQSATTVKNLAAKAAKSKTLHDLAQFQKAFTRHVAIQEQIAGMTAEAGRALQQFRIMTGPNYLPIAKAMAEEARAKDKNAPLGEKQKFGTDALVNLAEMIQAIDDPAILNKFTRDAYKVTLWDKIRELWINSLLSGPRTHATNILSNLITAVWQVPETAVASTIGSFHGGDKVRAREATARLIGVIEGAKEGMGKAIVAFKTGEPTDAASKIEQIRRKAIGGMTGEIVRIPTRALLAEDEFFKTLNYRSEINAQAVRIAINQGKSGQDLAERIAELRAKPPPSMQQRAHEFALYQTFQNQLGPIGRTTMRMRDSIPGIYLILPFIRTPANLIKYAAERTPFGLLMRPVRENLSGKHGNIARDTQIARLALGSGIAMVVASWALQGILTGSGPDDPDEKKTWLVNNQPYSIKIGDTWYSYQRLDPFGMIIGVTADLVSLGEAVARADAEKVGTMVVGSISENLLDKTWLSGLSDLIEAIQDPDRYGEYYLRRMAGTIIPNLSAQVAQMVDPVMREARSVVDNIKTRIPGAGRSLPPRRDIFGEPIRREGSFGPDLLSPIYIKTDSKDPVAKAMTEVGYTPGMPSRRINRHELTPQQYSEYSELAGKEAHRRLLPIINNRGWQSIKPDDKIDWIKKAFDESRDRARRIMKGKYPALRKPPQ
jgi:hypothetical protein